MAALLLQLALLLHCTPTTDGEAAEPPSNNGGGKSIGRNGGTVSSDGATLEIPPGALTDEVRITVKRFDDIPGLPSPEIPDAERVGALYELTPHGTQFAASVQVTLPAVANANQVMRLDDRSDPTWETVPDAQFTSDGISFATDRFSVYGTFSVPETPRSACDRAYCSGDGVKTCSSTAAACWQPLPGVGFGGEFTSNVQHYVTTAYGAELGVRADVSYAVRIDEHDATSEPADMTLSLLPLRADVQPSEAVTTEPFKLPGIDFGVPLLMVRSVFAIDTGYLIVSELDRPVLLHVTRVSPTVWGVRELRPHIGYTLPYEYPGWEGIRLGSGPLVAARDAEERLHIIATFSHPQQYADTVHRFTIPLRDFEKVSDGIETVDTIEVFDGFPLQPEDERRGLWPVSVARGPGGSLALLAHGWRPDSPGTGMDDVQLQFWNLSTTRMIAKRSFANAVNAASGQGLQSCPGTAVSTSGPSFGRLHTSVANATGGAIDNAAAFISTGEDRMLYFGMPPMSTEVATLARCSPPRSEDSLYELMSARLVPAPTLQAQGFSSVWSMIHFPGMRARFGVAFSPSAVTDELRQVEASSESWTDLSIIGAVPTDTGHRLFAKTDRGTERQVFVLELNADGTFTTPAPEN